MINNSAPHLADPPRHNLHGIGTFNINIAGLKMVTQADAVTNLGSTYPDTLAPRLEDSSISWTWKLHHKQVE